jgi:hypothetical protein
MVQRHSKEVIEKHISKLIPVKYNKFQWWRNYATKPELHHYFPLVDRINNGDFDPSPYLWMAQQALLELDLKLENTSDPDKRRDITSLQMEKYRRLQEDFQKDEADRLDKFIQAARKEFRISKQEVLDLMEQHDDTLLELYQVIVQRSQENIQKSLNQKEAYGEVSIDEIV